MSRFEQGVMAVCLHAVDEKDRERIFGLPATMLFDLAGVDRLEVRLNANVLVVRVHDLPEKGRASRW